MPFARPQIKYSAPTVSPKDTRQEEFLIYPAKRSIAQLIRNRDKINLKELSKVAYSSTCC